MLLSVTWEAPIGSSIVLQSSLFSVCLALQPRREGTATGWGTHTGRWSAQGERKTGMAAHKG